MTSQNISSIKSIMQTTNQTILSILVRSQIRTSSDAIVMLEKQITISLKQKTSNHLCYQFKPSKQKTSTQYTSG